MGTINLRRTLGKKVESGKIQVAVTDGSSKIYLSTDYGITWNQLASNFYYLESVAISSDGKYITVVAF